MFSMMHQKRNFWWLLCSNNNEISILIREGRGTYDGCCASNVLMQHLFSSYLGTCPIGRRPAADVSTTGAPTQRCSNNNSEMNLWRVITHLAYHNYLIGSVSIPVKSEYKYHTSYLLHDVYQDQRNFLEFAYEYSNSGVCKLILQS